MHWINWVIIGVYLAYFVADGVRRARGTTEIEGYFLANRSLPWWAVGLSVMATQLSAVTMIGTTGQGATDGMRFLQFYFGLPLAMVILGVTIVPFLRGARVFTAYEYLEKRFNAPTRSLTAFLFLCSRGMSCGAILAAPAVVFSAVFGWSVPATVTLIGVPTIIYTMIGGVQAVTWADVKQMFLIVFALSAIVIVLLVRIPVSPGGALHIAGAAGRLKTFDFSFNLHETYTFWSGLIGGLFLMLSYFGTDQSQVQRYLSARSVPEARTSLLMSAYWKIPLQAMILMIGILIFVFYVFQRPPLLYNPAHESAVRAAAPADLAALESRYDAALTSRLAAASMVAGTKRHTPASHEAESAFRAAESDVNELRTAALKLAGDVTHEGTRDVNYIIPRFVLTQLPLGMAGIFIAAVMAAAMSSIAAELNSLSTSTVVDFYRRWYRPEETDENLLRVSRIATLVWGIIACVVATYAATLGSLIEVVNRFGSYFYGSILGIFVLAMIPMARAWPAFIAMIAGMSAVAAVSYGAPSISFLWHNVVGALTVVVVGVFLSAIAPDRNRA
ncbi:MAG: sodium:solute symporter [Longimicrobiales bacterium]